MRHRTTITSLLVTAAVLLAVLGVTPAASAATSCPTEILRQHDLAVFEWNRLSQVNTMVTDQRLSDLQCGGFTTIYVDISEYVEVADQRPSPTRQTRLNQLNAQLKDFVSSAAEHELGVHAVAGAANWTDQSRRYLGPMTVDLVVAYNKNAEAAREVQLQGVQFDIEPYVERTWWKNVKASLKAYLTTIQAIVNRYHQVRDDGLQLGVAIPFWYDGAPDVPAVQFGSKEQPAAFHLIDMLRADPEAYLLVMAYRNFASHEEDSINADGSIALVDGEFAYANADVNDPALCGIVIGQEFGLVYPEKVSFGWVGRAAFEKAAGELTETYGEQPQFRGLSVNDLDAYEATPD
jgi:hypothetical protein